MLGAWLFTGACLIKGIKSVGKVGHVMCHVMWHLLCHVICHVMWHVCWQGKPITSALFV